MYLSVIQTDPIKLFSVGVQLDTVGVWTNMVTKFPEQEEEEDQIVKSVRVTLSW